MRQRVLLDLAARLVPQQRGRIEPSEIRSILAIKLDHIGDVLLTTPAFAALREAFPRARIVALVGSWAKEIVAGNPNVDEVILYDAVVFDRASKKQSSKMDDVRFAWSLRSRRFDMALAFRPELRTALIPFLVGARFRVGFDAEGRGALLNIRVPWTRERKHIVEHTLDLVRAVAVLPERASSRRLYMPVGEDDREYARRLLDSNGVTRQRPVVGIHPGAGYPVKRWRKEGFAWVGDRLVADREAQIVITGAPGQEEQLARQVADLMAHKPLVVAGKTSLRQLAAVAELCDVFLANDSGPMHIAAAMGTPVVDIRSAADTGGFWEPYGEGHIVISREVPCSPCFKAECETHECMQDIGEQEVLAAVEALVPSPTGRGLG